MLSRKKQVPELKNIETSISIIRELNEVKNIKILKIDSIKIGLLATLEKTKHEFFVSAKTDISSLRFKKKKKVKKVLATWDGNEFILEGMFTASLFLGDFEAETTIIRSKVFSEKKKLYQRLILPVKKKISFFSILEQRTFETPTFHSSESIRTNFESHFLDIYLYKDDKKNDLLLIDCPTKISHEEFSDKAFASLVALGYITGKLVQDEGVYFSYTTKEMKIPISLKFSSFRPSSNSLHHPIDSNPYGFKVKGRKGDRLYKKMKPLSELEFSRLCQQVYSKVDLRVALLMMMEALKGSIFTMATGMAVILETLTNLFAKENPEYFVIIKRPKVSSAILKELRLVITSHKEEIDIPIEKLIEKINQINQVSNKTKLTKPFEMLGFKLNEDDEKVIQRRNDLLHGRLSLEYEMQTDKADRELYLIATKLYTLVNVLILKQIGFSGYIVNWPVYNKHVHKKKLAEDVFRQI